MAELKKYKLGEVAIQYQQGAIRSNSQLGVGTTKYLKMGDLDGNGYYSTDKISTTIATDQEIEEYGLKEGDFLINVISVH